MNTKVRCKPRNMTNFNQKVKILKAWNFRYDTETQLCQNYTTVLTKLRLCIVTKIQRFEDFNFLIKICHISWLAPYFCVDIYQF